MRRALLGLALLGLATGAASAAEISVSRAKGAVYRPVAARAAAKASDLVLAGTRLPADARHALGPLPAEERAALASGIDPRVKASPADATQLRPKKPAVRVGLSRALPQAVGFDGLDVAAAAATRTLGGGLLEPAPGGAAWTAAFSSAGAGALRIHLSRAVLPPGSRVFVYSASGEVHGPYAFERDVPPEGFWTNTVFAEEAFLEVRLPAGARGAVLSVDAIAHLEHPSFAPSAGPRSGSALAARPKSDACFIDVSCISTSDFPNVAQASDAIGQLTFMDQGGAFVCTGGLLNTTTSSFVPYLLTANHCFDNQAAASSLEAIWQYRTSSCNGPPPSPSQFPRTLGSTLLATGKASDFTFVQLSENPPANSFFLGWDTTDYSHAGGTILHRVSNPDGGAQIYTKEQISAVPDPFACDGAPQGLFLYEKDIVSASGGGSSGSPVMLPDLSVVGQEYGECGNNRFDNCDVVNNSTLDGAFRVTFPSIQRFLQPAAPGACVVDANTLCLNNGRFKVTVNYATDAGQNGLGAGTALTSDSAYFTFFNPANIELVVKVLNACSPPPGRFWVFAGGLTNVHVVMNIVDTTTGATKTYENPINTAFVPLQDTDAFPCP